MPLASSMLGFGGEDGDKVADSMLRVLVNEVAQLLSPTSNNDAPNVDVSNIIVLNITLEGDDNAKHVVDLPQVSGDDTYVEESNEDSQLATKNHVRVMT